MDLSEMLKKLPFFSELSSSHLDRLIEIGKLCAYNADSVVFREGADPDGLYTVVEGQVRVFHREANGDEIDLAVLSSGQFFGEMALFDGQPRSASIICLTDCQFLLLERQQFIAVLLDSPSLLESVLADLSRRVRGIQEKFYWEMLTRQQTETRMELQRQQSMSQMVAGVAHEINTPLGIVKTAASLIDDLVSEILADCDKQDSRQVLADDLREATRLLDRNVSRASQLIQRFKNLSFHHASEQRERVSLKECVDEIVGLFEIEARKASIQITVEDRLPAVAQWDGFPAYMSLILLNLLMNARQHAFGESGGTIRIELELSRNQDRGDEFLINVCDDGRGIAEEHLPRIFDPFFTTRRENGGTGLGLSIVYNLVRDSLSGQLSVDSTSQGTRFHIAIPVTVPSRSN